MSGFNPSAFTFEQVQAKMDLLFAEARIQAEGRAQAEREWAEQRRERLILRGQARAQRGRLYDAIQLGSKAVI